MKLDVGCGNFPSGDVNCDLFINDVGHRTGKVNIRSPSLDPKKIKNFVLCDVQYPPFRDSVFDEVYSSHIIEHVRNPYLFLKEMIRISKDKIVILCPHRLGDRLQGGRNNPYHLHFLNKKWFFKQLKNFKVAYNIDYTQFFHVPFGLISLVRLPLEMRVEIRKCSVLRNKK